MTKNVQIDGSAISDWNSFHDIFAAALVSPPFTAATWTPGSIAWPGRFRGRNDFHPRAGRRCRRDPSFGSRPDEKTMSRNFRCPCWMRRVCQLSQDRQRRTRCSRWRSTL